MANRKRLLPGKVWFSNMDYVVVIEVKHCFSCQATLYKHDREPYVMSELSDALWEKVKIDFHGPLPCGDNLLEVIDEYSR